jgi:hypothetical protein
MKGISLSIKTLLLIVAGLIVLGIVISISTQNIDLFSEWGSKRINGSLSK